MSIPRHDARSRRAYKNHVSNNPRKDRRGFSQTHSGNSSMLAYDRMRLKTLSPFTNKKQKTKHYRVSSFADSEYCIEEKQISHTPTAGIAPAFAPVSATGRLRPPSPCSRQIMKVSGKRPHFVRPFSRYHISTYVCRHLYTFYVSRLIISETKPRA